MFPRALYSTLSNVIRRRPPVVTIMGHVDHGKTTLLDYLRKSRVAASEAGGITQHIGAFSVKVNDERITFLDTPGHAAFSSIRARGAKITDLIVLVVAAGDGVMNQTKEVIKLATKNNVPMIVAVNKCDAYGREDIRRAKEGLMREQVLLEEVGGETQAVEVSALTGEGVDRLLEAIMAQAEVMDLTAPFEGKIKASIIEARVMKGQGETSTIIIQEGTLRLGDILVGEESYCKVRSMLDHQGLQIIQAGPSDPVEVTGWKGKPEVGVILKQVQSESEAIKYVNENLRLRTDFESIEALKQACERERLDDKLWKLIKTESEDPTSSPRSVHSYEEVTKEKGVPKLFIILKCDVIGSLEALIKSIGELPTGKCKIEVISSGVGPVTISDLDHAKSSNALIIAFNQISERIIYQVLDDLKDRMIKLIPPVWKETILGKAKVLQLFSLSSRKDDLVIGCSITEGTLSRNLQMQTPIHGLPPSESYIQIRRDDSILKEKAHIKTMRHLKKEITSAGKGMECGILFEEEMFEVEPNDMLIAFQRTPSFGTID